MAGEREEESKQEGKVRDLGNIKGFSRRGEEVFFAKNVKEYQLQSDDDDATTELGGDCSTVCAGI